MPSTFREESFESIRDQERSLKRMKAMATGLLVAMATAYAVSKSLERAYPFLALLSAWSEAATVGALADWFAVVALFRHPLNLPIPRTAVIQKNKDRIAESLANFIKESFLSKEVLEKKLRSADLTGWVSDWLSEEKNAKKLTDGISTCVPAILEKLEDKDLQHFITEEITSNLHRLKISPLLANVLGAFAEGNFHQDLLSEAAGTAKKLLKENQERIREITRRQIPFYIPDFVAEKIYLKIVSSIEEILTNVSQNPQHEIRKRFHEELLKLISDLGHLQGFALKAEAFKDELLEHPRVKDYVSNLWDRVRDRLSRDLTDPGSATREQIKKSIQEFGKTLQGDPVVRERMNEWLSSWTAAILHEQRDTLVSLISETIKKWDPASTSQRIEFHVGKDLQWIRINGTIIGGLVGLLIYGMSWLVKNVF
jgi:uncharacterized membrane-anchored protein YjiN (DUF445 family)